MLIHGNTYDQRYWHAPSVNEEDYSFINYAARRGFDCLAVTLPGVGGAEGEGGDVARLEEVAACVASAIQVARNGGVDSRTYRRIILVGHSLGMIVALQAQSRWGVADAVIGQGTGFFANTAGPAPLDPVAKARALKRDQIELPGGERARLFYHHAGTDPAAIEMDNRALRTTTPRQLWLDALHARSHPEILELESIDCPVYLQYGEFDTVVPGAAIAEELAGWPVNVDVCAEQLDGIGHCFNLHRRREEGWDLALGFSRS